MLWFNCVAAYTQLIIGQHVVYWEITNKPFPKNPSAVRSGIKEVIGSYRNIKLFTQRSFKHYTTV